MSNSTTSVGFLGLLQIVLIVLKLTSAITWSWWWVLTPTWIMVVTVILFLIAVWLLTKFLGNK